jgi:anti-sigma28 factor (negative regulator of flagellin synthesis)
MKIPSINNYISYSGNAKPIKCEDTTKNKNYDVVEFNKNNTIKDESSLSCEKIKEKITAEINGDIDVEKLDRIKDSIDQDNYQVDVDEIVKRLLDK